MVNCPFCGAQNKVSTSKSHRAGHRGPQAFDVNTRAALGALHAGVGHTHLSAITSTLNIPSISHVSFKTREREIGHAAETVARKSCVKFSEAEKENALEAGGAADENGLIGVAVSYDMAWQRRNGGHSSNTGHGAVMGISTGKILDFGTRCKMCRICANASKKGQKPKSHDCRKNHEGSSKSMEPDVAVDLFQRATNDKIKYNVYTGDDDTTTHSHIREKVPYAVEKQSDVIHTKRSLISRLYKLKSEKKFPGCSTLSAKVINYLGKCFGYCVAQNKDNEASLQSAIRNIVPHSFGKHDKCNESWCHFKKDPTSYRHSELPFGKDLYGDALEAALNAIFDDYSTDIVVKELAPATNSQRNEAFNSVVGSKNPKIRFYGGSESNDFRVACGVCQTNEGRDYVCQTLREVSVEPGDHCIAHNKAEDQKYLKDKIRKSSTSFKKRRSQLHRDKLSANSRSEAREGTTYQTSVGLNLDITENNPIKDLLQTTLSLPKTKFLEYESMVPAFKKRPKQPKVRYSSSTKYQFVVFDIETTCLGKHAEICQLAAITKGGNTFNSYTLPTSNISSHASRINKLTVKIINGQRTLLKENVPVMSVPLSECLSDFIHFLFSNCTRSTSHHTILIGHNTSSFDTPTLLRFAGQEFKEKLAPLNVYFADSLYLVRALIKAGNTSLMINPGGKPCKANLPAVFEALFGEDFQAHDALEDIRALSRVLHESPLMLTEEDVINKCNLKPISFAFEDMMFLDERFARIQTFQDKLLTQDDNSVIKESLIQKIAESGLSYEDLQHLYTHGGKEALVAVLSRAPTGAIRSTPRGTKQTAILAKIVHHFESR
ncbi:uncharacterized protein LOC144663289 [Oculina patagonica]